MGDGELCYVEWVQVIESLPKSLLEERPAVYHSICLFHEMLVLVRGQRVTKWYNPAKKHTRVRIRTLTHGDDLSKLFDDIYSKIDEYNLDSLFTESKKDSLRNLVMKYKRLLVEEVKS